MLKKIIFFLALIITALFPATAQAQSNIYLETKVVSIQQQKQHEVLGNQVTYQKLQLRITKGDQKGETIIVENGLLPMANPQIYQVNHRLLIAPSQDFAGNNVYNIVDYIRRDALLLITVVFLIFTIIIARLKGLTSILAMLFSFFIIFALILPQILAGKSPILITLIGSAIIIPVTFFLSHGFNKKTHIAILSTLISLSITGLLALFFVRIGRLTGFSTEESAFLQAQTFGSVNIKGLLLSGIIIASLGILDDITISQSAIVCQLIKANPAQKTSQLFSRAMSVGRDHIASMANTLILVYTGAAMPLLLLFVSGTRPFSEVINYEIIAEEIIRTLVCSIGLILAVPLTTILAVRFLKSTRASD